MPQTSFAIVADCHVPACEGSAQEAVLCWALWQCASRELSVIASLGDLTAVGDRSTAERVLRLLEQAKTPLVQTPGNAELRTPDEAEVVRDMFSKPTVFQAENWAIMTLDSADGSIREREKRQLAEQLQNVRGCSVVIITHFPPQSLGDADRQWLGRLCSEGRISLIVAGHRHLDATNSLAGVPVHLVRGLDPDKAKHGPPALVLFHRNGVEWEREDLPCGMTDPVTWGEGEKHEFLRHLGISTMKDPFAHVEEATEAGIPALEVRYAPSLLNQSDQLKELVDGWRSAGGTTLSIHAPNLTWDEQTESVSGQAEFEDAMRLVQDLGADYVTLHVPRTSVASMEPGGKVWSAFLEVHQRCLRDLGAAGTTLGIENLHMKRTEPSDDGRCFGYLPGECLAWIRALRGVLPGARIGLHLDIGHARTNPPFMSQWTLGRWYAEAGREVVGYHLHQVGGGQAHQPMHTLYGPQLSLASFFWAWQTGQLAPGPMFLEIRGESPCVSWDSLQRGIGASSLPLPLAMHTSVGDPN